MSLIRNLPIPACHEIIEIEVGHLVEGVRRRLLVLEAGDKLRFIALEHLIQHDRPLPEQFPLRQREAWRIGSRGICATLFARLDNSTRHVMRPSSRGCSSASL